MESKIDELLHLSYKNGKYQKAPEGVSDHYYDMHFCKQAWRAGAAV